MGATISNDQTKKKDVVIRAADDHDWSNLHQDIVICLAEQIVSVKDYFAFRGVCKSWRSAANKENSHKGLSFKHKVPVLLLPKEISDPFNNCYSLTKGKIYQLGLPETKGKMCYSSLGWLIHAYESRDCLKLNLFSPLNHALIELPPLRPRGVRPIKKFVLSSSPSWTSDYAVMALAANALAFFRPGYNNGDWAIRMLNTWESLTIFKDTLYYKGQFYVVNNVGCVFVYDMKNNSKNINKHLRLIAPRIPKELLGPLHMIQIKALYLVESAAGVLFLVVCHCYKYKWEPTYGCRVFEVPFGNGKSWSNKSEVTNLGNTTLFLGANNSSLSIKALDNNFGCKVNCIYFINKSHLRKREYFDIGIYHIENGKIEQQFDKFFDIKYKETVTSHAWIQPSF